MSARSSSVSSLKPRRATKGALRAPADAPTSTSGAIERSASACSMPTCTAPRLPPPESTNAVDMSIADRGTRRALERRCQPGEAQRSQQQSEVAQCDVVVVAEHDEVDDDARQPRGDEVSAELRAHGHDETGDDLDDTHDQHCLVG